MPPPHSLVRVGDLFLGRYQIEASASPRGLYNLEGLDILTYHGFDTYRQEPITLRAFPLPESPPLAAFAKSLWDREMRTSFIATTSRRGECLLRVIDSRHLANERLLMLVTQQARHSLREALTEGGIPAILRPAERGRLWMELNKLLISLYSLHSVGLMHRNISLDSVYVSSQEDGPFFKLGDYSWTVYLHNLSSYLKSPATRLRDTSSWLYRAPELRESHRAGESFSTDLFALGTVMAALVSRSAREALLNPKPAKDTDILDLINDDETLSQMELLFFKGILATDPAHRFENALRASERALQVVSHYANAGLRRITSRLTVSFNINPEMDAGRRNLKGLSHFHSIEGISSRLDDELRRDLTGAEVFASGFIKRDDSSLVPRLYLRGRSGQPYSAKPYWNSRTSSHNLDVAVLTALDFDPANTPATPLAVLEQGVVTTRFPWDRQRPSDSWAPLFLEASRVDESTQKRDEAEVFRDNLWRILDAEQSLLAKQILPVKVVHKRADTSTGSLIVSVAPLPGISHPEYSGSRPETFEKWLAAQVKNREMSAYLCPDPTLTTWPAERERVTVLEIRDGVMDLDVGDRSSPAIGEALWLKPGTIRSTMTDHDRKRRALMAAQADDYLVQVLSRPEQNTIFLNTRQGSDVWTRVLNTRPLFVIQGPPGTGKTFTATRVITTALKEGTYNRILVVAQAHKPLDHLKDSVARALQEVKLQTPPIMVRLAEKHESDWGGTSTSDRDLDLQTRRTLQRAANWNALTPSFADLGKEWNEYVEEQLQNPSNAWTDLILRSANIVFTTAMSGAMRKLANHPPFDLVVVEEAAKAYPTELLAALRLGRNWLLIGDQMQLPPFQHDEMEEAALHILESDRTYQALEETEKAAVRIALQKDIRFFGSLHEEMRTAPYPFMPPGATKPVETLTTQRRLPPEISKLISRVFYKQPFVHATEHRDTVITHPAPLAASRLIWIDCPPPDESAEYRERALPGGGRTNHGEASLILRLLSKATLSSPSIAILSPYTAQVKLLRDALKSANLPSKIGPQNVHTVDSFQGREADLVILSMVRNNLAESPSSALGFLRSPERMNVMLSRAKRQLVIVGNLRMLSAFRDGDLEFLREIEAFMRGPDALVLTPNTAELA